MSQVSPLNSMFDHPYDMHISLPSHVGNSPIRNSSSSTGRVAPLAPLDESCLSDRQKKILGIAIVIVGVVAAILCAPLVMAYGAIGFAALGGGLGIALAGMWIWVKSSRRPNNELSEPQHIARTQTVAAATLSVRLSSAEMPDDFFRRLLIAFAEPLKDLTANQKTYWLQEMSKHEDLSEKWRLFCQLTPSRDEDKIYSPLNRAIFCLLDHMHDHPESIKDYLPCLPFFMFILSRSAHKQDPLSKEILIKQNTFLEDKHLLALNTVSQALIIHYPKAPLFAVARGCLFPQIGYHVGLQGFISIYHQMQPEAKGLNPEILVQLIAKPGPAMPRDLATIVTSYLSPPPYDFIRLVMAQIYSLKFQSMNFQEYLAQLIHSGNNDPEFIKAISDPFAQQSLHRTYILQTLCRTSDSSDLSVSTGFKTLIPFIENVVMAGCERERDGLKQEGSLDSLIYPLLNEEMSKECQEFLKLECQALLKREWEGVQGENFFDVAKGKFFKFIQTLLVKQIPAETASLLETHLQQLMDVRFARMESVLLDYYYLMFLRFKITPHTENQIPNLNPTPTPNITPAISLVED